MTPPNAAASVTGPVVLIIRDGWGMNPNPSHDAFNAVKIASQRGLTPVADRLMRDYPWTLVKTSGEDVGLPDSTMGNSEVGHQNIGAGRVVPQESLVMTKACQSGLHTNPAIAAAIARVKDDPSRTLHLMGINSDAGVHGLLEHLFAILRAAKTLGLSRDRVVVHLFADGRDSGPFTGKAFAQSVEHACNEMGIGRVATVCGRYYAMDRDHRWERVKLAYDLLLGRDAPAAPTFATARDAFQAYYDAPTNASQQGDEFITPRRVGAPAPIRAGDSVIFYNYRGDRPRELCAALVFPDAQWAKVKPSPDSNVVGFDRGGLLGINLVTMTQYWEKLEGLVAVAFPKPSPMRGTLGEAVSAAGATQFRCAETEKYPHVTFFFNDYRDEPFPGESRENPQSPKVATYDLAPEMAADAVRDAVLRRLGAADCERLIVVNFANGDMVGHTGKLEPAIAACAAVDRCVGPIVEAALARGGACIVTADHGNAEQMFDPETNSPHTAHTTYDVPLVVVSRDHPNVPRGARLRGDRDPANWTSPAARAARGRLADIAPTALALLGIAKPADMRGESLIIA
jgi:2,3-bisphosphoglycerate-independent phosphoglycerate mutase